MKSFIIIVAILLIISCAQTEKKEQSKSVNETVTQNLDWLLGDWIRSNDNENRQTFEHWTKESETEYVGLGYTLQKLDTVFKESLKIIQIDGIWNYEVTGVNEDPVFFEFTQLTENNFVCENEQNKFPKKIEYVLKNGILTATISAGDKKILFVFKNSQ